MGSNMSVLNRPIMLGALGFKLTSFLRKLRFTELLVFFYVISSRLRWLRAGLFPLIRGMPELLSTEKSNILCRCNRKDVDAYLWLYKRDIIVIIVVHI